MKKTILSITTIFITSFAFSQSLTIVSGENYKKGFVDQALIEAHAYIQNTTSTDVDAKVRRQIISQIKYSINNFCWGPVCYPDFVTESPTANTITPSEIDSTFIGDYTPAGNAGISVIKYLIFNTADETDSISHTVTYEALPLPKVTGSLTYCTGDQTTLDAGAGYDSYLWSNSATTQTITVGTAGDYSCQVAINSETRNSDTVTVSQTANYSPQILGELAYCENGDTELDGGAGYDGYLWSDNNQTTQKITVTAGTYTVTVSSANLCTGTATITVTEITNPSTPDISWDGTMLSTTATGDYITWYKDGYVVYGEHGQTYEPEGNGDYTVEVCDTSACCCTESSVETLTNVGIGQIDSEVSQLKVYPNPANSQLTLEGEITIQSISVYNVVGELVLTKNYNNNRVQLNVSNLKKGVYFYEVQSKNLAITKGKFTVNR